MSKMKVTNILKKLSNVVGAVIILFVEIVQISYFVPRIAKRIARLLLVSMY